MNGADQRVRAAARLRAATLAFGSCAALVGAAAPAAAQPADEPVGVMDRPRPDYDPIGDKLGSLMLHPQLKVDAGRTDNVFATETNRVSDSYVQVAPRLSVKTDWPRHELSAAVEGRFSRYDKLKTEDTDEWSATAGGRLDVQRDLNLKFNVSHFDKVEPRTSAVYLLRPLEPVTYRTDLASVSISKTFNRLRASATVSRATFDYDATRDVIGDILDQSYRDREETDLKLRLAYAVSPKTAFFVEGGALRHDYDTRTVFGGSRDSKGQSLLFGVEGEITRLIHGEASAGIVHYEFDNPAFNDVDNFNYKVALEWYPTPLLTVGLAGAQALYDTPLPTTPGYIYQSLTLSADYELRRNLILSGRLMAGEEDYQGVARKDKRYGGSLAARYLLNRGVGISVRYDHEQRDSSSVSAASFRDNTVGVGVTLER